LYEPNFMSRASRSELIAELRERLRQLEHGGRPVGGAVAATGTALDHLLPDRGLTWGTLTDWLSDGDGTGTATLALAASARVLQGGGALVVVDRLREFYPPAAAALGIPLARTVIIRPDTVRDALWALEQSLRSSAVAVAWCWLGSLDSRIFRRLQLAAEAGGGLGFLFRPVACRAEPSWAAVRLLVEAVPAVRPASGRRLRALLLAGRGVPGGQQVELELGHEADPVRVASPVAHPTPAAAAGA
jgi:hypothetical protein